MTTIICHPENADLLRGPMERRLGVNSHPAFKHIPSLVQVGIYFVEDSLVPVEQPKEGGWVKHHFPYDPFVEYREEDLPWMLPLGLATVEREMERVYYMMDEDRLPDLLAITTHHQSAYCPPLIPPSEFLGTTTS